MSKIAFIPSVVPSEWETHGFSEFLVGVYKQLTGSTNVEFHSRNCNCNCESHHPNKVMRTRKVDHIVLSCPTMSLFDVEERFAKVDESDVNYVWGLE